MKVVNEFMSAVANGAEIYANREKGEKFSGSYFLRDVAYLYPHIYI